MHCANFPRDRSSAISRSLGKITAQSISSIETAPTPPFSIVVRIQCSRTIDRPSLLFGEMGRPVLPPDSLGLGPTPSQKRDACARSPHDPRTYFPYLTRSKIRFTLIADKANLNSSAIVLLISR